MGKRVINNIETMRKMEDDNMIDGMWGGTEEKQYRKRNHKGFTLVELIVVIVILAILAAILIPGLLKWIDEARDKQYMLEAKSICQAAQAEAAKIYAKEGKLKFSVPGGGDVDGIKFDGTNHAEELNNIKEMSGIDDITLVQITFKSDGEGNIKSGEIINAYIYFKSSDETDVIAVWNTDGSGQWEIIKQ